MAFDRCLTGLFVLDRERPRRTIACAMLVLLLAAVPTEAQPDSSGADKPTLQPHEYGRWESFADRSVLSPDGRWLAYRIRRVDRTGELRVRSLADDTEHTLPWGEDPVFSDDSAWLSWRIGLSDEERERLSEEEQPIELGAGLLELASGEKRELSSVSSRSFDHSGRFVSLLGYAPKEPKGKGADLTLIDLHSGTQTTLGNVSEAVWSEDGSRLALAVATGSDKGNGVQLYDAASGRLRSLDSSDRRYRHLVWREEANDLAVLRSSAPASQDSEAFSILAWRGVDVEEPSRLELTSDAAGIDSGYDIVQHRAPEFSTDGRSVAFGLRPSEDDEEDEDVESTEPGPEEGDEDSPGEEGDADSPEDADSDQEEKEDEELPALQIWHSNDLRIYPQQKAAEDRDSKRTLTAVWHLDAERVVVASTDLMAQTELLHGFRHAIEKITEPYAWGAKFGRPYHDVWLVDLSSGERRRVLERTRYSWPSPAGRFLLFFDGESYGTIEVDTGQRATITAELAATFANQQYDTPTDLLPPYGVGGWIENDESVLLYDRFDVWRVDPRGDGGTRLTAGADQQVIHRILDLAPEEDEWLTSEESIYFALRSELTEQRGFARLKPGAAQAERLRLEDRLLSRLQKAEKADVYVFRSESRVDSPDLFAAASDLTTPRQLTQTNPFQSDYAWTRAELLSFDSEKGQALQAALLYPANHDPGRRYPMIVYTYEILAPQLHSYQVPDERSYYNFTAWTQQGYFVLLPDIVYTAREPGTSAIAAVRPAVAAVTGRGLVDPDRVGLIGHSWGGYQATYLPTRIDIFAASVAGAPLTDFVSFMGQIHWNPGLPELTHWETGQGRMEVPYWEDPDAHHRNSPIHAVHEMETPLLMAFGSEDGVVDWDQGTEFYNFARRAGRQMVLLVYEGEDHGFREKANQIDYHRRILEWFGHYLKGEPAPDWITRGVRLEDLEEEKKRVATASR